ncbi:Spindle assembly abnormal protein [Hirschfeldia incana]|nr:Spindle assembly abnormal protein [Hirschfeldia incana]KAJ0254794.1 Spindle assembly abnormal protein [Hirschfeldia incana]
MSSPFYSPQQDLGQSPPGFDNEPVPVSTYQDTEPVPLSTYHETEPNQPQATQQELDDFWENGFNREEAIQEPEPPKENGKRSVDNSSFTHGETDLNQLPAIPPVSTGQGPPYAPVDWPSPGDVWTWRVGRRVTALGFHQDRFLILPQRLQQKNVPKSFASKPALARYIQMSFPDMDADAFFASFSWKIPALFQPADKVDAASLFEETPKEVKTEGASATNVENGKEGNSRYSQRKRNPMPTFESVVEKPKVIKKKKGAKTPGSTGPQSSTKPKPSRQSSRRPSNQQSGGAVELNLQNEEEEGGAAAAATAPNTSGRRKKRRVNVEEEDVSIPHIYVSPMNGVLAVSHEPIDVDPIEFDSYLNSLENLLHQGPDDDAAGRESSSSVLVRASSPMREYEWAEARMKISSLLEKDFPTLFVSKDAAEIAALATKLRKDPNLSAEEIVRLKLIEEIPTFSEVFQENKAVIEEADRFFSALELNKAKVASLKYEYSDLKHKLGSIQMEVDENSEAIRQIDEQIAQLQARRTELKKYIGSKEKEKVDLSYGQKMVANSIPKVVQEVQAANSKKPEWECKKENALKREEEILSKFNPLKGFFL